MKEHKRDKRVLIPRDEFEEEAGEGLGRLSREEAEADLRQLKARMEGRLRRPRAIWIPAVAAVAILVAASAVVVSLLRERPSIDSQLAQKGRAMEEVALDDSTLMMAAGGVITDTALIAMAQPIEKADRTPGAPVVSGIIAPETVAEASDEVYVMVEEDAVAEVVTDEPVISVVITEEEMAEEVVVEVIPQAMASARKTRAATDTRVTAEKRTATETREVAAARDEKKAVAAKDVAEKAEPAAGANVPVSQSPAAPLGGWEKYEAWASRNIMYPEGIEPVLRQEVVVSFKVHPDSTLSDLKAVSSPGEPFTREAFRLLVEGPKWVPAANGGKPVAEEVVVKIVFK
jgi:hypothetical protein